MEKKHVITMCWKRMNKEHGPGHRKTVLEEEKNKYRHLDLSLSLDRRKPPSQRITILVTGKSCSSSNV